MCWSPNMTYNVHCLTVARTPRMNMADFIFSEITWGHMAGSTEANHKPSQSHPDWCKTYKGLIGKLWYCIWWRAIVYLQKLGKFYNERNCRQLCMAYWIVFCYLYTIQRTIVPMFCCLQYAPRTDSNVFHIYTIRVIATAEWSHYATVIFVRITSQMSERVGR